MNYGFVRVAAVTPEMRVADVPFNTQTIIKKIKDCSEKGVQLIVFPELCISGYTCSDLFFQPVLLEACKSALKQIVRETESCGALCFVGLPFAYNGKIYNVAAAFCNGKLLGLVPKQNLPNYNEFYEARHFSTMPEGESV